MVHVLFLFYPRSRRLNEILPPRFETSAKQNLNLDEASRCLIQVMLGYGALYYGNVVEEIKDLLRNNPTLDVNSIQRKTTGTTLIHGACENGHDSTISILLAHPDIDVNLKNNYGQTPFMSACLAGKTSCVRQLLRDPRVKVNEPSKDGETPLNRAAYFGHHDVIKLWIASGREMDLGAPGDVDKTDAIEAAKKKGKTEVVTLLERFKSDASRTRDEVRKELGTTGQSFAPLCLFLPGRQSSHLFRFL